MTARTVVGTVEFPVGSGAPCVGARVVAQLYTGAVGDIAYGTANDMAVGSSADLTDNDGAWSLDLEANSGITPAGTVWLITVTPPDRTSTAFYIQVPDTAGPHDVTDLLTEQPGSLTTLSLITHIAIREAHDPTIVNIADLNSAAGDGATDVSQAYRDAYAAVAATRYTNSLSTNGYARKVIEIPPGTHRVESAEAFMRDLGIGRTAGFVMKGAGRRVSVIDWQPATANACLFRNNDDWLFATFEDISFSCSGVNAATATWMESDSDGGPQFQTFNRCDWFGQWKRGLNLTGSNTNDTMSFHQCGAFGTWEDGFLWIGPTDTSDQNLAFSFVDFKFEVTKGAFVTMHKGGDVSIIGGSFVHTAPSATSTFINLMGTSHAYGVCSFRMVGARMEHRNQYSKLIYCEWPQGVVSFLNCDTTSGSIGFPENAAAVTAEFAFTNVHGSAVEWTNCMLAGRHKYTSLINGWNGSHRVHYQSCEFSTQPTAHEFLDTSNTGNAGGIPAVSFDDCRGQANTNNQSFDCVVNWEKQWKGRPKPRRLSLKLVSGGSPITTVSVAAVLPPNSVITKVWAVKTAGGSSVSTTWAYTLTDADAVTVAQFAATGTVWNTAWSRTSGDLYVMCATTNSRTLTLSATVITESSPLLHIVIEYLA